jgi:hypothetical protein
MCSPNYAQIGIMANREKELDIFKAAILDGYRRSYVPLFSGYNVSLDVWDEVEDMTEALRKMQEEGSHTEKSGEE